MKRTHQQGSLIAILAIIFAVALMGALGFIFWQNFIKQTPAQDSGIVVVKKSDAMQPTQDQANPNKGYLVIKEWSVRFPLVDPINDAVYKIENNSVKLSTTAMTQKSKYCGVDSTAVGGSIMRGKEGESIPYGAGTLTFNKSTAMTKIGEYYYVHFGPQAACTDDSQTDMGVSQAFQAQVKKLEASQ